MKKSIVAFILTVCMLCFTACSTESPQGSSTAQTTTDTSTTFSTTTDTNSSLFTPVNSTEEYFKTLEFYDYVTQQTIHYLFHEPLRHSEEPVPLVIFLHGRGDTVTAISPGTADPMVQALMALENENDEYSTYTLVPSTPLAYEGDWTNSQVLAFKTLIYDIIGQYNIDLDRIYISGISMGGFMTCRLVSEMPYIFAAAVPLSGAQNISFPSGSHRTAFRIYHVATDPVVNVSCSRSLHQQLLNSNHPNVEYVEYPDGSHISPLYTVFGSDREEFFDWLFSQHLS